MALVWWAWAPFIAFIMITGFIVFNLIIAVVCDAVAVVENKEDLEPHMAQIFTEEMRDVGVLGSGSKEMEEEEESGDVVLMNNMTKDANNGTRTYEEELVEDLAGRISSVLNTQKEMLATLESLTEVSLVPSQAGG